MPLYLENEESISSDLVIDSDTAKVIRMTNSIPLGDTTVIEIFDNDVSYAHLFNIYLIKDSYVIKYHRAINHTELFQRFDPVKCKLELNSSDFSNGNKIRGHVEYIGECVDGCTDKNKRVRIEGNFAVRIFRY